MPRPALPPTPASSTDIKGQDGTQNLASLQMAFELPPPAIIHDAPGTSPTNAKMAPSDYSSTSPNPNSFPVQASETVKSRRRASSAAQNPAKESFALPPPPTRSRKIIQMKPRPQEAAPEVTPATKSAGSTKGAASGSTTTPSKRKQPSATSAAGRKIARKTAHSLIERRRRSKMNEEFAVLKGMIPACTGEMHKLAILQASIEYVRYLEDCVTKLQAQRNATPTDSAHQTSSGHDTWAPNPPFVPRYHEDEGEDVEMTGSEAASPTFTATHSRSQQPSISPALLPQDENNRHGSYSSASTDHRHYSYSASSTTSPAFGPQRYSFNGGTTSASASTLTSPALAPLRDLDQEATAALLMLNNDRRGTNGSGNGHNGSGTGRGMSVRDLLST